jgi:hypothetical protein
VSPELSSPQPPVPQPRKSSKTPSTDPVQEHPVNDAENGDDLDVPENVPAEAAPAAEDSQSADVPTTAAADEADSSGLPASTDAGYVLKEDENAPKNLAAYSSDGATASPPPPPPPTVSNLEMNGGTAVGDIRSAFAFLDKEGGGRESSLEPSWEGMTGSGGSSGSSAAFSGNDGGACIEVNLVRNRLSIFERLSQQANADAPINRPTFYRRAARAKSEARERVCSPGPPPAERAPVSFSERVRRISEQEAVIYEGMARNAAEDHEDATPPASVGHFPLKTQIQENVISEYTRKHSMEPHHPSSPPPPLAATKEAVAPTAVQPPAAAAQSPTKTGYTHHHLRVPTAHAQQSPTMESIQRSLGLTEVERPAIVRDKTPEEVVDAAAVRRSQQQQRPAHVAGGGGTYTLQKSGFSVTLKNQRGATATDPAARKHVYTQYRELLKKFSHHREETV